MLELNKEVIVIFFLVLLAVWVMYPFLEGFNVDGTEFAPLGAPRYGLRGNTLKQIDIANYYMRPDVRVVLNQAGGELWQSNNDPGDEGIKGCYKVPCPANEYYNQDVCYKCGKSSCGK